MKYVLFGAGIVGERYYHLLKDDYDIVCFADNEIGKHGQKYMALDVVSPDMISEMGLSVIIALAHKHQFAIVKQLFGMGIKDVYIPENADSPTLTHIDLNPYPNLDVQRNKICVLRAKHAGAVSACLVKHNPFPDIDVVLINNDKRDSRYFYHYITCSLVITQFNNAIYENKKSIELWHAFPTKHLSYMCPEEIERQNADSAHQRCMSKDIICSLSKLHSIFFGYCQNVPYENFRITGYPRNDALINSDGKACLKSLFGTMAQKRVVIYLPTHRIKAGSKALNGENTFIFNMPGFDATDFDKYLSENGILFITKMHAAQMEQEIKETENSRIITDEMLDEHDMELNEILNGTDCLISDYSSVIIDYLLIDKPIVLTPTDLEAYAETRGLMMEPYDAWMPGEIALDYEHLKIAISGALYGEDRYKKDRERLRRITHKYADAKSTERVLNVARELLGLND